MQSEAALAITFLRMTQRDEILPSSRPPSLDQIARRSETQGYFARTATAQQGGARPTIGGGTVFLGRT